MNNRSPQPIDPRAVSAASELSDKFGMPEAFLENVAISISRHFAESHPESEAKSEWQKHAEISDREFLQMSDWLIGNSEFDLKTGLIDHAAKLKERIRDLIAKEGELGDLKEQDSEALAALRRIADLTRGSSHEVAVAHLNQIARDGLAKHGGEK